MGHRGTPDCHSLERSTLLCSRSPYKSCAASHVGGKWCNRLLSSVRTGRMQQHHSL